MDEELDEERCWMENYGGMENEGGWRAGLDRERRWMENESGWRTGVKERGSRVMKD